LAFFSLFFEFFFSCHKIAGLPNLPQKEKAPATVAGAQRLDGPTGIRNVYRLKKFIAR
jgi:hypothetical protein